MTETTETKPTETVKEPVIEKIEPAKEPTLEELKAENARLELHAKNKEQEAERHFKKLQTFEKAEQDKKDAELSELDKEKKARVALEAENKKIKLDLLKQSTASKLGIPELADRLQGETPEEIEQDAKQLLEKLPKKTSSASATNPGGDHQVVGETDAERRKRLGI